MKRASMETPPPSPCIGVCRLDDSGQVCTGCRRTLDEIAAWSSYSKEQKEQVWQRLLALPLPVQAKTCPQCGNGFTCGAGGESGGCWCADLPLELSPSGADSDCLCPVCLQKRLISGS
ncbi:cysteine-rich CWC family protein [Chromobacterium vaccinii]|uniref:Cysteine-rich CWC family protein n=1 Tax=Chromobacterium vaccinii TaxID=1108595 RepID=A0ABV0F762_9NEIS